MAGRQLRVRNTYEQRSAGPHACCRALDRRTSDLRVRVCQLPMSLALLRYLRCHDERAVCLLITLRATDRVQSPQPRRCGWPTIRTAADRDQRRS